MDQSDDVMLEMRIKVGIEWAQWDENEQSKRNVFESGVVLFFVRLLFGLCRGIDTNTNMCAHIQIQSHSYSAA